MNTRLIFKKVKGMQVLFFQVKTRDLECILFLFRYSLHHVFRDFVIIVSMAALF